LRPDTALDTSVSPSPNHGPRDARLNTELLLLHYTGMPDAEGALKWLCSVESQVSAHYFVFEDGRIVQMVPECRRAWHAGASLWAGERDINGCSIGIEIANDGAAPYPEAQMRAVEALCLDIIDRRGIAPRKVLGHSDVAPGRKIDPGAHFDWRRLYEAGIGHWVEQARVDGGRALHDGDRGQDVRHYQAALARYGYGVEVSGFFSARTRAVTDAFQRHFYQRRIDGVADPGTRRTLERLLDALQAPPLLSDRKGPGETA
jgi:N-acetylmuramoyl-L-alanine amidase